jgi:predicted MFS family arabinose efflux permease
VQRDRLDRRVVLLLAFGCGAAVANIYYAQPLLNEIGDDLNVSSAVVGLLVTASQIGYGLGLALLVPLGDLLERRRLTMQLLAGCAVALAVTAAAPSFPVLAAALLMVGITSAVAQVLVPMAASLAAEDERGRVVGTVMSGLFVGIIVARIFSGLLAEIGGWRLPFVLASGVMLVLVAGMLMLLPTSRGDTRIGYGALLRSVLQLIGEEPVLRRRMVYGSMSLAGFSAFWTALTFMLASSYGYGAATIGLFGLVGLVGAGSSQLAGHAADRGWLNRATGLFLVLVLVAWGLLAFGASSLAALIAGIIVLDFGNRGQQISNQSAIYARRADSHSRMTTAYMTSNFIWGALGSAAASVAYSAGGWSAVVALGAVIASVPVLYWLTEQLALRRAEAATSSS